MTVKKYGVESDSGPFSSFLAVFSGPPDPTEGEHLFTITTTYRVDPFQGTYECRQDNLVAVSGPACHWCGAHNPELARLPCPGPSETQPRAPTGSHN